MFAERSKNFRSCADCKLAKQSAFLCGACLHACSGTQFARLINSQRKRSDKKVRRNAKKEKQAAKRRASAIQSCLPPTNRGGQVCLGLARAQFPIKTRATFPYCFAILLAKHLKITAPKANVRMEKKQAFCKSKFNLRSLLSARLLMRRANN